MTSFNSRVAPDLTHMFNNYSASVRAEIIKAVSRVTNKLSIVSFNGKNSNINYKNNKVAYTSLTNGMVMLMVKVGPRSAGDAMMNTFLSAVKSIFLMGSFQSHQDISVYTSQILKLRNSAIAIDTTNKSLPAGTPNINIFGKYPYFNDRNNRYINKNDSRLMVFIYPGNTKSIDDSVKAYIDEEYMTTKNVNIVQPENIKRTDPLIEAYGEGAYSVDRLDNPDILQLLFNLGARRLYNADGLSKNLVFDTWKKKVMNRYGICTIIPPTSAKYPDTVDLRSVCSNDNSSVKLALPTTSVNRPVMVAEVYPSAEFFNTSIKLDSGENISMRKYLNSHIAISYTKQGNVIVKYNGLVIERSNVNVRDTVGGVNLITDNFNGLTYSGNDFNIAATIELGERVIVMHCLSMPVKYDDIMSSNYLDHYFKFNDDAAKFSVKIAAHMYEKYGKRPSNLYYAELRKAKRNKVVSDQVYLENIIEDLTDLRMPKTFNDAKPLPTPEQLRQEAQGVDAIYSPEYEFTSNPVTTPDQLKELLQNHNEPPIKVGELTSEVKIHDLMKLITAYIGSEYHNVARSTNDANTVVSTIESLQKVGYIPTNIKLTDLSLHTVSQDYCVGRDHNSVFGDTGVNVTRTAAFSFNNFMVLNQYAFLNSEVLFFMAPRNAQTILEAHYTEQKYDALTEKEKIELQKYSSIKDTFKIATQHEDPRYAIEFEEMAGYSLINLAKSIAYKKLFDIDQNFSFYVIVSVRHIGMKLAIQS